MISKAQPPGRAFFVFTGLDLRGVDVLNDNSKDIEPSRLLCVSESELRQGTNEMNDSTAARQTF